jgi:tetratricopeptide (TPR) repeat protein
MVKKLRLERFLPPLILFLVIGLLFGVSLDNPFIFDDIKKIVENPDVQSLEHFLSRLFHEYDPSDNFSRNDPSRPLVSVIYTVLYHLGGGKPLLFHAFNLLVHFANTLLTWGLFQNFLNRQGIHDRALAFLGSLLFAILPIQAGTVMYAYGLSDLLCAFSVFSCLLVFTSRGELRISHRALLIACFLTGLAAKQLTVVLPLLLLASDRFMPGRSGQIRWKIILPLSGLGLAYLLLRWVVFGTLGDLEAQGHTYPWQNYLLMQSVVLFKYLWLILWPFHLTIDHGFQLELYPVPLFVFAWVLIAGAIAALLLQAVRSQKPGRISFFCASFYLILLLPLSSFFPTTDALVERRVYGATFAVILSFLSMSHQLWQRLLPDLKQRIRPLLMLVLVAVLAAYSLRTWARNRMFGHEEQVWEEALQANSENPRALNNLAQVHYRSGRFEQAIKTLERLVAVHPEWGGAWNNLGVIYGDRRLPFYNLALAEKFHRRAFEAYPGDVFPIYNIAALYGDIGRVEEAEGFLQEALKHNLRHEASRLRLIESLLERGKLEQAKEQLKLAHRFLQPSPRLDALQDRLATATRH